MKCYLLLVIIVGVCFFKILEPLGLQHLVGYFFLITIIGACAMEIWELLDWDAKKEKVLMALIDKHKQKFGYIDDKYFILRAEAGKFLPCLVDIYLPMEQTAINVIDVNSPDCLIDALNKTAILQADCITVFNIPATDDLPDSDMLEFYVNTIFDYIDNKVSIETELINTIIETCNDKEC